MHRRLDRREATAARRLEARIGLRPRGTRRIRVGRGDSASIDTAPASRNPEFSPFGSIGDSATLYSTCAPMGSFSSGAT